MLVACLVITLLATTVKSTSAQASMSFLLPDTNTSNTDSGVCMDRQIPYADTIHKEEYRVGVLAIRGFEAAYKEFNTTFSDYLTATAGARFSNTRNGQPIKFTMVPLNFLSLFDDVELATNTAGAEGVDFIYVNPSAFSCIESEYGANTLVSQISRRVVGGQVYQLTKFGGVIFSRADNEEVNEVEDLRDKVIAAASISGLGSGQMQFRLLQQRGLSYIQDPKQLVFTSNQGKVVNGVLQGKFDVGFVRTDQIERTKDALTGELVNTSDFKIINGFFPTLDDKPFPFKSSTTLYPEWNLASLSHVDNDVALEVQKAMLAIQDHSAVGAGLDTCYKTANCTQADESFDVGCMKECTRQLDPELLNRCDTTPALASLALSAKQSGKYTGWRSTLSYMELRNMQEETNFIRKQDDGSNACIRSAEIVDAVVCPPGHFRKTEDQVLNGCSDAGLECADGFQCLCKPCVKAFDVDILPMSAANMVEDFNGTACPKFTICGQVSQTQSLIFRVVDNKERAQPNIRVRALHDKFTEDLKVIKSTEFNHTYYFSFDAFDSRAGIVILEVFADGEQIAESPLRLEVTERACAVETGDKLREADDVGNCVCSDGSHDIGGKCVANSTLIPSIVVPLVFLVAVGVYLYIEHKQKQADAGWRVKPGELIFEEPPEILGRGTFGLVIKAEFRGTQVAVKRVIPPRVINKEKKEGMAWLNLNTLLGEGDTTALSDVKIPTEQPTVELDFSGVIGRPFEEGNSTTDEVDVESGMFTVNSSKGSIQQGSRGSVGSISRKSLFGNGSRGSSFFDFDNLDAQEDSSKKNQQTEKKKSDDNVGLEPGGMHTVLGTSQPEQENTPPVRGVLRQLSKCSVGSLRSLGSFGASECLSPVRTPKSPVRHVNDIDLLVAKEETRNDTDLHVSMALSMSGTVSGSMMTSGRKGQASDSWKKRLQASLFGEGDEFEHLKQDFVAEMRHLSKLRHPCITTVMGAVISKKSEPMLIMEFMDHGSLYDLLHNESMIVDGELVLPILRDIAQGVRFLHAANPKVIHGDLKAANVLVDSKFRAKVSLGSVLFIDRLLNALFSNLLCFVLYLRFRSPTLVCLKRRKLVLLEHHCGWLLR